MAKNQGSGDGLKQKLKSFLGLKKSKTIPSGVHEDKEAEKYIFTHDVLKELSKENNFNHRSRVLRELCEVVSTRMLEEHAVEAIWHEIEDLLQPSVPTEPRQTSLKFLTCLASGQYETLGLLKAQFLKLVENHDVAEDLNLRIELLRVITEKGKDISYCEHIGPFLLVFTTQALNGDRADDFLLLLINFMHYNSSFLDKEIITGLVEQTCEFCNRAKDEKEIESSLQLLDATVRYGGLPSEGLYPLIATLCRTVNIERFCQASWKLMKTLVGTKLGHSSVYIMCCILEDENNLNESILLRGAVFFIGMCVWGSKRVSSLQHKPISLLPSFKQALHCNHPIVAHEIGLSLQRLVKKYGKDLKIVTWDIIFDLTDMLIKLQQTLSSSNDSLKKTVHDLMTNIEELYTAGKFDGEAVRLFAIVERCSSQRPELSVLTLLSYLNEQIHPAKDGWLEKLKFVMEKYFHKETRTNIRVKVLDMLSAIMSSFRFWYEEELIEVAVLPNLNNIDTEPDANVRRVAAQLLIDLIVVCNSNKCMDILSIVFKLIQHPVELNENANNKSDDQAKDDEWQLRDIQIAVNGLISSFKQKLFESPPSVAVRILEILVDHVCSHYIYGFMAETGSSIRFEVLCLFLSIRADSLHRIGVIHQNRDDQLDEIKYSVLLSCMNDRSSLLKYQEPASFGAKKILGRKLSLTKECPVYKVFDAILNCLKDEWDWKVLEYVLKSLPDQLQNKSLILGSNSDVTTLCAFLCKLVNDSMFLNKVRNVPAGSGKTELHNMVYPILAVLVTYHDVIEKPKQIELVKSLELGLNSQCSRLCVIYLTICTLEMKSIMLRLLPSILLKLSKISATVPMSIPMLEFLSSLKEVKPLYSNFVEEQYMSIFAIALPYTDAHKYLPYTVTLAHYVIAAWFTRCRLSFRKGFVRLITKGLQSSSALKASASQSANKPNNPSKAPGIVDNQEFQDDMTTVCSDMMAKFSFSILSNQPKRSPIVEFLLSNGLSQSWLVGNTIVTVTTSGAPSEDCPTCTQRRIKVAAAKAAEKLRRIKRAEHNETKKTKMISDVSEDHQSLFPEVTGSLKESFEKDRITANFPSEAPIASVSEAESIKHGNFVECPLDIATDANRDVVDESIGDVTDVVNDNLQQESKIDSVDARMKNETQDENPIRNDCMQIFPNCVNYASEKAKIAGEEVSLMNKLALEQQQLGAGKMFSPSEYLFSAGSVLERGVSLTASIESEETVKDQIEDLEVPKTSCVSSSVHTHEDSSDMDATFDKHSDDERQQRPETTAVDMDAGAVKRCSKVNDEKKLKTSENSDTTVPVHDYQVDGKVDGNRLEVSPPDDIDSETSVKQNNLQPNAEKPSKDDTNDNLLQVQSSSQSQQSSAQVTPIPSRKTSLQTSVQASLLTSIELSSDYEVVDKDDLSSNKGTEVDQPDTISEMKSLPLCNCSCDGWAEILIRRPTGNTSWIMKIENPVAAESEASKFGDVMSLAASVESDDYKSNVGHYFDPASQESTTARPRFLSVTSDELSRERQNARSSSDSPKTLPQDISNDSPLTVPRRRFSTGSMEFSGDFWFNLPSPESNSCKADEILEDPNIHSWQFEKPSLGLSPISSLKRQGSFNCCADFKEKKGKSTEEPSTWKILQNESYRLKIRKERESTKDEYADKSIFSKPKKALSKSISSPLKIEKTSTAHPTSQIYANQGSRQFVVAKKQEVISRETRQCQDSMTVSSSKPNPVTCDQPSLTTATTTTTISAKKDISSAKGHQEEYKTNDGRRVEKREESSKKADSKRDGAQVFKDRLSSLRPRGQTISVYPVSKKPGNESKDKPGPSENWLKTSLNPYFVFLQFFYSPFMSNYDAERPLLLGSGEVVGRSIKILDRIPPYEHHKIGILYVGPQQESNETAILANEFGSSRYIQFLSGLGDLICLPDCCPTEIYTGGLDRNGADGKYAYSWRDDITQVIFHAATLMPNKLSDPACHSKKLHIGNNFVTIVYNDSKRIYNFGTIRGQFNFAEVLIKPLDYQSNVVAVRVKEELKDVVTNTGPHVISDSNLPILVRQLAIHTNMATVLQHSRKKTSDAYGCNWLERLKQIKRIRSKAASEYQVPSPSSSASLKSPPSGQKFNDYFNSDFTDYT